MEQSKRRSVVADRSSRNHGDQPLSPPDTPSPPFAPKITNKSQPPQGNPTEHGRNCAPWEVAKLIELSPQSSTDDPWKINSDPNIPDLAATMNPHVGLNLKGPIHAVPKKAREPSDASALGQNDSRLAPQDKETGDCETHKLRPQNMQLHEGPTQDTAWPAGASSLETDTPAFAQESLRAGGQEIYCIIFPLLRTLASVLILSKQFGPTNPHSLQTYCMLWVFLSGLEGACLAYISYANMPQRSVGKGQEPATDSSASLNDPELKFLSTTLTANGLAIVRRSQELHTYFSRNVLKALISFVMWDVLRIYAAVWPMLHIFPRALSNSINEPPVFGPAPGSAKIGIFGYPPRLGAGPAQSPSLATLVHLLLPLIADAARLVGLWFSYKTFILGQGIDETRNKGCFRCGWVAGGGHRVLLLLVALPVAFVLMQQAFWNSNCLYLFPGMELIVGSQAAALADLLQLGHSFLLAVAAALAGAVLAAAFAQLSISHSTRSSRVLSFLASLALFCCIVFDVLAALAPSVSCPYTLHLFEIQSSSFAVNSFATVPTLAHSLALLCLSCSASLFGLKAMLVGAVLDRQPIDESYILGVSTQ